MASCRDDGDGKDAPDGYKDCEGMACEDDFSETRELSQEREGGGFGGCEGQKVEDVGEPEELFCWGLIS